MMTEIKIIEGGQKPCLLTTGDKIYLNFFLYNLNLKTRTKVVRFTKVKNVKVDLVNDFLP